MTLDSCSMRKRGSLSLAEARRLAIASQGLARMPRTDAGIRDLRRGIDRLGLLQIDSVNVLVRAHYMPLYSRLGAYDTAHLDKDAYRGRRRRLFEYWGREASLIPVAMHPLFRWRMHDAARGKGLYKGLARFARERPDFVAALLADIRSRGPLSASELGNGERGEPGWWGWSDAKLALEYLFWAGEITTARREKAGFARIYDIPERTLHADVLALPTPPRAEAQRALMRIAIRALGIAGAAGLREYFRLPTEDAAARVPELVELGDIVPVTVDGARETYYIDPAARIPRKVAGQALLSPFDPLIAERGRTERLFDFHYRIEIYTPVERRRYGYYCLPLLLGDAIVGRFDLKADRVSGTLVVAAAHREDGTDPGAVATAAAAEIVSMARWLGLASIRVEPRGNLASRLVGACA